MIGKANATIGHIDNRQELGCNCFQVANAGGNAPHHILCTHAHAGCSISPAAVTFTGYEIFGLFFFSGLMLSSCLYRFEQGVGFDFNDAGLKPVF
jgi:hypothetical protein